jgi:hypothetical protein
MNRVYCVGENGGGCNTPGQRYEHNVRKGEKEEREKEK